MLLSQEKEVLEKRNQELTAKATRLTTEVSELRSENEKNKTELQETSDRASQLLIEVHTCVLYVLYVLCQHINTSWLCIDTYIKTCIHC